MLRAAETTQRTDTGRQRRGNEDASYARPPVFVVADGMGGAQAGEVASGIAVETFEQGLPPGADPEERLAEVVRRANRRIYDVSRTHDSRAGMGTTLTAAYLDDTRVAIAHVGDSRAYLFRDGELTRLTEDHSLVEELRKKGKLTEEQALEHPQRSIITRALGPEPEVEVDTWSYGVRGGDVILLCSDGLTSMIAEQRVQEVLAAAPTLDAAADGLIASANEAGGRDNITVVLFRVEDVGDGGGDTDQPTMVAAGSAVRVREAPVAEDRPLPPPEQPDHPGGTGAVAPVDPGRAELTAAVPSLRPRRALPPEARRAPRRPADPAPRERHFGALGKLVAALAAVLIVLLLVGGGGYLATRQLYFLGTNGQGMVTVYRGLPYDLPFGIPMYETFYVSGVPAAAIPAERRATLLGHDLRSQTSATNLINAIERGDIAR